MNWILVAIGGGLGAMLRYGFSLYLTKPEFGFPWQTWWVNILGTMCAGIFFAISQKYPVMQNEARLFLMVGILGGFTTFSSFGLETFQLLKHGHVGIAFMYVMSSVVIGLLLLALGYYATQWSITAL